MPTGDINGDGVLRLSDILTALAYCLKGEYVREADATNDGAVTLIEILRALNMLVRS